MSHTNWWKMCGTCAILYYGECKYQPIKQFSYTSGYHVRAIVFQSCILYLYICMTVQFYQSHSYFCVETHFLACFCIEIYFQEPFWYRDTQRDRFILLGFSQYCYFLNEGSPNFFAKWPDLRFVAVSKAGKSE